MPNDICHTAWQCLSIFANHSSLTFTHPRDQVLTVFLYLYHDYLIQATLPLYNVILELMCLPKTKLKRNQVLSVL